MYIEELPKSDWLGTPVRGAWRKDECFDRELGFVVDVDKISRVKIKWANGEEYWYDTGNCYGSLLEIIEII